ncbi:Macrophage colony-stimulating factor 1 receptor [Orchesella cincta]|uniref:Macrophage colony-stimulating factor 1 receptor n=1 Tax=Orchesella cincta TaxID=48709 RepID=A0A1D2NHK0_ORCCI|nr:Macrophage colony-stimulating factor 1 receptor [Orchesella cincta]
MKMSKTPSKNTLIGQKTRFLCYYSEFFISNGIVWSLEMKNGSMSYFEQSENQQMGNTSFSQIEINLNNTDVAVIRCHAPVRTSQYEWRNLSGPLFVRDLPKIEALWVLPNGTVDKVLSGNVSESKNLILEDPLLPKDRDGFMILECNASFPLDWVYSAGEGLPEIDFQAIRYTDRILTSYKDYTYSAKLKFFKINRQIVGRYSCLSANREFGHRGKEEDLKADFHVFVPGESIFTNQNNQTVRVWEYRDSVLLPCPVTDPRVNVTLHKYNNATDLWENLDPNGTALDYGPMSGFVLSRNVTDSLFGTYRCEAICKSNKTHVSGVFSVILPFDPATRLTPFQKQVKIYNNETQLFKCEAKEEVTLVFSDEEYSTREIIYETDLNSQFPYSASYLTEIEEFFNFTIINCTTRGNDTKRVLHTWEFYPDDPNFIDSFTFDNTTAQLVCCSKPYRDPVFEWMNCSSISECYSRQAPCLRQNKCQSAYTFLPGEIERRDNGCIAMNITEKPQGFIRCVVGGVHKIVSQAYMYYYNADLNYEIHDGYFLAPRLFEKNSIPSENVMKLDMDHIKTENITVGESVRFFCSASKFFSGAEIKWAFERNNGTMEYALGKDLSQYTEVESEITKTFEDGEWKAVYCLAPNWNEYYGWRNVSKSLSFTQELVPE